MNKKLPIAFHSPGDFLNWWFEEPRLQGKAESIFKSYYSNYSDKFYDYLNLAWTDRHLELERELDAIRNKPCANVLDIGCGTGSVSLYIAYRLGDQGHVLGIDINKERLYCALERKNVLEKESAQRLNCEFKPLSIASLPLKEKYDLIYLEEALHHIEPRREILKRIVSLLKHDGVLIISEVNAYNPFMQLYLFKKRGLKTIEKKIDDDGQVHLYGAERILSARKVVSLVGNKSLKVKSLRYFRVISSALAQINGKKGFNLMGLEKRLLRFPFLSRFISIHYNIVFHNVAEQN